MSERRWQICPRLPDEVLAERVRVGAASLERDGGRTAGGPMITPLLVQLLANRGVQNPADYDAFLAADERLSNDYRLLPDIDKAVTRLLRALLGDEIVAVYGDFDADGITATVLLVQGISRLGGRAVHYIPHRFDEGHGLNYSAMKLLRSQGAGLVVTVDCGINGFAEVEQARGMGLDIIITDHHVAPDVPPPAVAAIDPKRVDSPYPYSELAGVGVACKLLHALFDATGRVSEWADFLDLVVLGTVADMVPLDGENRYLARHGLDVLNRSSRVGVQELVSTAGLELGKLDSESISYSLGPRLNASGRMNHAVASYELLNTSSREQARELAAGLELNNAERQRLTAEFFARAKEDLLLEGADRPLLMVSGPDYPSGVAGVVAGKLVDEFYRPAIVLRLDGDTARGSARSIPEFDIVSALTECQDLLSRYGGHRQAAGFLVQTADLDRLHPRLLEIAARELEGVELRPATNIDAEIPLSGLSADTYQGTSWLEPFGQCNQEPVFLSRRVKLVDSRKVGSNGDHLKLKLRDGGVVWDAIAFDLGNRQLSPYLDIVYHLEKEEWRGRELLRLNVIDFVPSP